MLCIERVYTLVKKIVTCDFPHTQYSESSDVAINDQRSNEGTHDIQNSIRRPSNNGIVLNSVGIENYVGLQRPPIQRRHVTQIPTEPITVGVHSTSTRQGQNVETEKVSRTFKDYVQRQLDDLTEETLKFQGAKNHSEYERLQRKIQRELEALESMDIDDKNMESKWKTQLEHLKLVLTHNATKWQEVIMNYGNSVPQRKYTNNIAAEMKPLAPIHQTTRVNENVQNIADKQAQEEKDAYNKLNIMLKDIEEQLVILSERVFNYCSNENNQEYNFIEASIMHHLKSLERINCTKIPEMNTKKFEMEQFGKTWLNELQRRSNEMKIRRYEARVKALW